MGPLRQVIIISGQCLWTCRHHVMTCRVQPFRRPHDAKRMHVPPQRVAGLSMHASPMWADIAIGDTCMLKPCMLEACPSLEAWQWPRMHRSANSRRLESVGGTEHQQHQGQRPVTSYTWTSTALASSSIAIYIAIHTQMYMRCPSSYVLDASATSDGLRHPCTAL